MSNKVNDVNKVNKNVNSGLLCKVFFELPPLVQIILNIELEHCEHRI